MAILYEREKGNVKVVAMQTRVEEEGKFAYTVQGFVNGKLVKEEQPEGGFRKQAPAARAMFKELATEFLPKEEKAEKESKPARAYTLEERDAEVAKLQRRIARLMEAPIVESHPEDADVDATAEVQTDAPAAE